MVFHDHSGSPLLIIAQARHSGQHLGLPCICCGIARVPRSAKRELPISPQRVIIGRRRRPYSADERVFCSRPCLRTTLAMAPRPPVLAGRESPSRMRSRGGAVIRGLVTGHSVFSLAGGGMTTDEPLTLLRGAEIGISYIAFRTYRFVHSFVHKHWGMEPCPPFGNCRQV